MYARQEERRGGKRLGPVEPEIFDELRNSRLINLSSFKVLIDSKFINQQK